MKDSLLTVCVGWHLLEQLDLNDVTLVGFSMGGGEVARYFSLYGTERLRSVVFASTVPPYMMQGDDNPEGPLTKQAAANGRSPDQGRGRVLRRIHP